MAEIVDFERPSGAASPAGDAGDVMPSEIAQRVGLGVWLVDKPAGPTSHDIVARIRRRVGRGVKVGHTGTLDPFATGLLVVVTGKATRLTPYLTSLTKRYTARIVLGATSPTGDSEGEITPTGVTPPTLDVIDAAIAEMLGESRQQVPTFSAVKVGGVPLHRHARRGTEVERPERTIAILAAERIGSSSDRSWLDLDVTCSKGTYIRQIAVDLGEALGCGAYCGALRRTAVGDLRIDDAVDADHIPEGGYVNPVAALRSLPHRRIDDEERTAVGHGRPIPARGEDENTPFALVADDQLVAIATSVDGLVKPRVVLT